MNVDNGLLQVNFGKRKKQSAQRHTTAMRRMSATWMFLKTKDSQLKLSLQPLGTNFYVTGTSKRAKTCGATKLR